MKHSDKILQKSFGRGLTVSERQELREAYNYEQLEDQKSRDAITKSVKDFKDDKNALDLPRHRMYGKCPSFLECPFDFKCRNYNPAYVACVNCVLHETDDVCRKPHLHHDKSFNMLISRERIDLDEEK